MITTSLNKYIIENPDLMLKLSSFEDKLLREKLKNFKIKSPVYITGLARSGTTITLEFLAKQKDIASHTYSDFPFIYTPYLSNKIFRFFNKDTKLKERAHLDRIKVNNYSPESFEEIIWARFFENLHDVTQPNILDKQVNNKDFEIFYKNHIRKLLLAKKRNKYISKSNYNITRLSYLKSLFNDLRVIIMIRNPVDFISSSIKQDNLFCNQQKENIKKLHHTNMTQHFEFGLNKIPVNFGDNQISKKILDKLNDKDSSIEGWSEYWDEAYKFVIKLKEDEFLKDNIKIFSYEDLCNNTEAKLLEILDFCNIEVDNKTVKSFREIISFPLYYKNNFSNKEIEIINNITKKTKDKIYTEML